MTIARVIQGRGGEVWCCAPHDSVRDAVARLAQHRIGALPVVEQGRVIGIFSERDVVKRLAEMGPALLDAAVSDIMTSPVETVDPALDVIEALGVMTERRFRHLPVVEQGQMVAFVSIGDLVKYRIERIEADAEAMRSYIQSA
ncbi:MAG: CBS domain-containing protein [Novosphingobium sp.]